MLVFYGSSKTQDGLNVFAFGNKADRDEWLAKADGSEKAKINYRAVKKELKIKRKTQLDFDPTTRAVKVIGK